MSNTNRAVNVNGINIQTDGVVGVYYKNINTLTFTPSFIAGNYTNAENLSALKYTWEFGDGVSFSGNLYSKKYKKRGTFTVTLYVYENGRLAKTLSTDIVIKSVVVDQLEIQNVPTTGVFETSQSVPLVLSFNYTIEADSYIDGTVPVVELYSKGSFSEPRLVVNKWSHLIPQWYFTDANDVLMSTITLNGLSMYSDLSGNTSNVLEGDYEYLVGTMGSVELKYVDDLPTYDYSRFTDSPVTLYIGINVLNKKQDIVSVDHPSYSNAGLIFPESLSYTISNIPDTRKFETIFPEKLVAGSVINVSGVSSNIITKAYLVDNSYTVTSQELYKSVYGADGTFSFNIKSDADSYKLIFEYDGGYGVELVDLSYGVISLVSMPKGVKTFIPVTVHRLEPNALAITKEGKSLDISPIQWVGVKSRFVATVVDSGGVVLKNYPIDMTDTQNKIVGFSLLTNDVLAQGIFEYNNGSFVYADDNGRRIGGYIKNWFKPYFVGYDYKIKVNGVLDYYKNDVTVGDSYNFKNSVGDFTVAGDAELHRSVSGLYCVANELGSGVSISRTLSADEIYNFDFYVEYLSGGDIKLTCFDGDIDPVITAGANTVSYAPLSSCDSFSFVSTTGYSEFVIKYVRVYQDSVSKTFNGYSAPFSVYDLNEQKTVRKINQTVDMAGLLKSYALQEQLANSSVLWGNFASTVFGTLSSDINSVGNTLFEKIGNFFENHVGIDTCEVRSIDSINALLGVSADKYVSDVPLRLGKILDIISINDTSLTGTADLYKRNYIENYADTGDMTSNIDLSRMEEGVEIIAQNKEDAILKPDAVVFAGRKYVFNTKHTTDYETIEIPVADGSWKNFADADPYILAKPLSAFPLTEYPLSAVRHGLLDYPIFSYYDVFSFRDVAKGDITGNILDYSLPAPLSGFSRDDIAGVSWGSVGGIQDILIDNVISKIVLTYDVSDYVPIVYPSVVLTSAYPAILNGPFTVTATFSAQMSGFELLDITAVNAVVSNMTNMTTDIYTFTVTPNVDGAVTVNIPSGVTQNYSGLSNSSSNTLMFVYDTVKPVVTITNTSPDITTGVFTINIKFSEIVTNFSTASLTLTNCTVSNHVIITDLEHEYLVTPITAGLVAVEIAPNTVRDIAGNMND